MLISCNRFLDEKNVIFFICVFNGNRMLRVDFCLYDLIINLSFCNIKLITNMHNFIFHLLNIVCVFLLNHSFC